MKLPTEIGNGPSPLAIARERLYRDEAARQSHHARRNTQDSKSHRKTRRKRLAELGIDPDKIKSVPPRHSN